MKLEGCSNAGLSYTDKYKKSIIKIFECVQCHCNFDTYDYNDFQNLVHEYTLIGTSEIRMLIPFLVKLGIINERNIIRGKSKIKKMKIDENLFSIEGKSFVNFLKIEQNYDLLDDSQKRIIKKIYSKFGLIQFNNLRKSDEFIYDDLFIFLNRYQTIDKNEFFILTHCRQNNLLSSLDEYVKKYRANEFGEIEIVKHVNSYQYITNFLLQVGVLEQTSENYKLKLSGIIKNVWKGDEYEFRQK